MQGMKYKNFAQKYGKLSFNRKFTNNSRLFSNSIKTQQKKSSVSSDEAPDDYQDIYGEGSYPHSDDRPKSNIPLKKYERDNFGDLEDESLENEQPQSFGVAKTVFKSIEQEHKQKRNNFSNDLMNDIKIERKFTPSEDPNKGKSFHTLLAQAKDRKKEYYRLAKIYNPDNGIFSDKEFANRRLQELNDAYNNISSPSFENQQSFEEFIKEYITDYNENGINCKTIETADGHSIFINNPMSINVYRLHNLGVFGNSAAQEEVKKSIMNNIEMLKYSKITTQYSPVIADKIVDAIKEIKKQDPHDEVWKNKDLLYQNLEETDKILQKYEIHNKPYDFLNFTHWFAKKGIFAEGPEGYKPAVFAYIYRKTLEKFLETKPQEAQAYLDQFLQTRAYIEDLKTNKKIFQELVIRLECQGHPSGKFGVDINKYYGVILALCLNNSD